VRPERAVVLAAGLGTRLKWLTRHRPKALMQLAGEPAIVHVIRRLAAAGVHEIAINLHHHGELLAGALGDGRRWGVRLAYSPEKELLDSGGGVRRAMELLPGDGPVLVHNADIISDIDFGDLAGRLQHHACALAMVDNPPENPAGDFALCGGRVIEQGEPRLTFAGVSLWQADVLLPWPADRPWSLVEAMREQMRLGDCAGLHHRGLWYDIGKPRALIQARRALEGT